MADTTTSPQTPSTPSGAQTKKAAGAQKKAKNPKSKPNHPPTSEMVNSAIKNLKERGGSSLQAIKKYVAANYKIDADKLSPFIKKYLKAAVVSGALIQTKGKGASGSFKLSSGVSVTKNQPAGDKKPVAKPTTTKKSTATKPKAAAKKSTPGRPKASPVVKSPVIAKRRKATAAAVAATEKKAAAKSPSKVKRSNKGPTKKPKAPKPKRTKPTSGAASPAKGAKKASAAQAKKK